MNPPLEMLGKMWDKHIVLVEKQSEAHMKRKTALKMLLPWIVVIPILPSFVSKRECKSLSKSNPLFPMKSSLCFLENKGQWPFSSSFAANLGVSQVFLDEEGIKFTISKGSPTGQDTSKCAIFLDFLGEKGKAELVPESPLPGTCSFFLGNDPKLWRTGVRRFKAVRFENVYTGISVRVRPCPEGIEYDILVSKDGDLSDVEIQVQGAEGLFLEPDGTLVMETAIGPIRQPPPLTWEIEQSGKRHEIACRYVIKGPKKFGFGSSRRSGGVSLVVDPKLVFSTYLGGSRIEEARAVSVDSSGNIYVTGWTNSLDFPVTAGCFQKNYNGGLWDCFISKFDSMGKSLIFSTYLGGKYDDDPYGMALDASGNITITGGTKSPDFPVTKGAWNTRINGGKDAFIARLGPMGKKLVWSTYFGGNSEDYAVGVFLDKNGYVTVSGATASSSLPVTPYAWDKTFNGGYDGFMAKLDSSGSKLVSCTYLGGKGYDFPQAIGADGTGTICIAGYTSSRDFPVTSQAWDKTFNGKFDVFVTRMDPLGSLLLYSTYLGGTSMDIPFCISVMQNGEIVVAGETKSSNFPVTKGAWDRTFNGGSFDAFVTRIDPTKKTPVFSTFLGGRGKDQVFAIKASSGGEAVLAGGTQSPDFPTTPGAFDRSLTGRGEAFVARLDPSGKKLLYSTLLGGNRDEIATSLFVFKNDCAVIAGHTWSANFPTTPNAFKRTFSGGSTDVFVTKLPIEVPGIMRFGKCTPACSGSQTIYVTGDPVSGTSRFGFECWGAPPKSGGVLLISNYCIKTGFKIMGITLWVPPLPGLSIPVSSDGRGISNLQAPIPSGTWGMKFYSQYVWLNTASCGGQGTLSASDALEVVIR